MIEIPLWLFTALCSYSGVSFIYSVSTLVRNSLAIRKMKRENVVQEGVAFRDKWRNR